MNSFHIAGIVAFFVIFSIAGYVRCSRAQAAANAEATSASEDNA